MARITVAIITLAASLLLPVVVIDLIPHASAKTWYLGTTFYNTTYLGLLRAAAVPTLVVGLFWSAAVLCTCGLRRHAVFLLVGPACVLLVTLGRMTEMRVCTGYAGPFQFDGPGSILLGVLLFWELAPIVDRALFDRTAYHFGQCHNCGYDQRGLPGPICPECGTRKVSSPASNP